jgi:3-hydroxyisobutyrate dehydrogenase-like beta-hydroxyacid dehydrogenase
MGSVIAQRLEELGTDLIVFNRSPERSREFAERAIAVAESPADAAARADIVITVLSDGRALEDTMLGEQGVLTPGSSMQPPAVVIDMSTTDVAASQAVSARASELGIPFLRAPVSGNPSVVAAGKLTILVSGPATAFEQHRDLLAKIGPTIFYLGDGEQARIMKLALNLMVGGTIGLLAEALVMGEAHGLDRAAMLEVMGSSAVGSPLVKYKTPALVAKDYTSTFSVQLMRKDLDLVLAAAKDAGVPVTIAAVLQQLVDGCIELGMGDLDFAALVPRLQREAGQIADVPFD